MALKDLMGKTETPEPVAAMETPPAPRAPATRSPAPATFLDASTRFEGTLRCTESLRIDGSVEGEVHCDHGVAIGEPARVQASIDADSVVIAGEVKGDITARSKITLERSARVTGDLCTPGIVIQEGAKLEGRIMIGSDEKSAARRPAGRPAEQTAPPEGTRPGARSPLPPVPGTPPPAGG